MIRSIVVLCLVVACASAGWIPRTKKRYDPNAGKFLIDVSLQSRNALYFPELFEYLKNLTRDEEAPIRQHGLPTDRRKRIQLLEMLRTHRDIYPLFNKTDKIYRIMDERKALMGPEANKFFDMVFEKAVDLHYNYVASYKLAWTVVDDSAKSVADKYKELSPEAQLDLQYQFPEMKKALEGIAGITVRTTTPSTAAPTTTTTIAPPTTTTTTKAPASTTPRAVPASTTTVVPPQPTSRSITVNTGAPATTTTRSRSTTTPIIPTQSHSTSFTNAPTSTNYIPPESDLAVRLQIISNANLTNAEITTLNSLVSPSTEYNNKEEFLAAMKTASPSLHQKYISYNTFADKIKSMEEGAQILVNKFFAAHPEFVENYMYNSAVDFRALIKAVKSYLVEYTQLSSKAKEDLKTNFETLYYVFKRATRKN